MSAPLVALVGRPNVGKSTLFNRFVESRTAIVAEEPGTTRDRVYGRAEWQGRALTFVDTGGLVMWGGDDLTDRIREQAELAMAEADAVLFLVDLKEGLTGADSDIADRLRRSDVPVILVDNKADNTELRLAAAEFYGLGVGDPQLVSALHGTGTGDLLDQLIAMLPEMADDVPEGPRLAIVGRPNVGKSTLLNALLKEERAIVDETPGTTRDALDTPIVWQNETLTLIDTAGIRRRGRVAPGVERYSVLRALRAIGRANVALLLIDASEGLTAQDAHIAGFALEEGAGLVLVVNKWDLVKGEARDEEGWRAGIRRGLRFFPHAPVVFTSALTAQGVDRVVEEGLAVCRERLLQVDPAQLNELLHDAVARHPPSGRGRPLRFFGASQKGVDPPAFAFYVNDPRRIHFSYRRYLENRLRERF
ncbi:MAG: ribosome biogenesis GTPase Der, partial [Anaerolineae bacterium]